MSPLVAHDGCESITVTTSELPSQSSKLSHFHMLLHLDLYLAHWIRMVQSLPIHLGVCCLSQVAHFQGLRSCTVCLLPAHFRLVSCSSKPLETIMQLQFLKYTPYLSITLVSEVFLNVSPRQREWAMKQRVRCFSHPSLSLKQRTIINKNVWDQGIC